MQSEMNRGSILNTLQDEWMENAKVVLTDLLNADINKLENVIEQALQKAQNGSPHEVSTYFAEQLQADAPKGGELEGENKVRVQWLSDILDVLTNIDTEIVLEQEEKRFTDLASDSAYVKFGKLVKRFARGAGNFLKRENDAWQQQILLRNLVTKHLLKVSPWVIAWNNELRQIEVEILLEADAWILHSTGLIRGEQEAGDAPEVKEIHTVPNRDDLITFLKEAQKSLNELKSGYLAELETRMGDISKSIEDSLSKADTFELSNDNFSDQVILSELAIAEKTQTENQKVWRDLKSATIDRLLLSISFTRLSVQVKERVEGFNTAIREFFDLNIESGQQKLKQMLEEAIHIFDDSDEQSMANIRQLSTEHQEKMDTHTNKRLLKPLNEMMEEAVLSTKLDRFTSAISEWTKDQPKKAVLVQKLDMTQYPPRYEFKTVDWQSLVQRIITTYVAKEFLPKDIKPEQFLAQVYSELKGLSEIIYTNLEIADEVKKTDEEDPLSVAREGLERAMGKLDEDIKLVQQKKKELIEKLLEKSDFALSKLATLLERQDLADVRMAGAQYKAKETATDWKTRLQIRWSKVTEKIELFARFIWMKTKKYFTAVQDFLGFGEKEKLERDKTDLATFLSETDEKIAELPFIYRRLFDFHKQVDQRFFIRRPEQFERFRKGYEMWQNNFPSTFAVVGEKGSGKSLFVKMLSDEVLTKNEVHIVSFDGTVWKPQQIIDKVSKALKIGEGKTIEELIEAIERKKKRIIVVLEDIQNCFIRNISGFDAMETLLFLISETNKSILWVSTCTRYGWLFLDKVLNCADYFTHLAETDNLTADQIKQLVLKRHMASGYQLQFLADEATKKSRNYKKMSSDEKETQEHLKDKYFEKLSKLSEGNPSVALIFWIRSIKEFDDTHFHINPFDFTSVNRIDELETKELFSLAAFVIHDSLLPEDLSRILHQPLRDSKLMISRLTSKSILYKADHGYLLNHLIYRQVVRVLKEANYIH